MVIAGIPFTMPAIWIGLIVIFLIIEGLTAGLVTIWFAVGALAALIAAMFHAPLWLQLVWFFAVSIAAFAVTRPLVKKYINNRTQPTNVDMLIGQECLVTEDIDNLTGHGAVTVGAKSGPRARSYWSIRAISTRSTGTSCAQTRMMPPATWASPTGSMSRIMKRSVWSITLPDRSLPSSSLITMTSTSVA